MAKEQNILHLYAFGDIGNFQGSDSEEYGIVSLSGIMRAFKNGGGSDSDSILLHIHSGGGDLFESLAIFDYLTGTGKPLNTVVEGVCASAATVLFLAGTKRTLTPNSRFLVHNPWLFAAGDADELEEQAVRLRQEQDKMVDFYEKHTGTDRDKLQALMSENRILEADEALEFGFATEILDQVKALMLIQNKHRIPTINNKKTENIMAEEKNAKSFVAGVMALATSLLGIKADGTAETTTETTEKDTDTTGETTTTTEKTETTTVEKTPEQLELEELKAENARLKEEKEAEKTQKEEAVQALTTANEAMMHMKTTFVPQARTNSFEKVGVEKEGQEADLKERMKARKAATKQL